MLADKGTALLYTREILTYARMVVRRYGGIPPGKEEADHCFVLPPLPSYAFDMPCPCGGLREGVSGTKREGVSGTQKGGLSGTKKEGPSGTKKEGLSGTERGYRERVRLALNMNDAEPEVEGVEGLLDVYKSALDQVKLYGPTNFADVIKRNHMLAKETRKQHYHVLVIVTDGDITDMQPTKNSIVAASYEVSTSARSECRGSG
eukprot:604285-Rhodomonas_salina.1